MEVQIINKLQGIFRLFFRDNEIVLSNQTTAQDIDKWDSLIHLELISVIEHEFNLTFSLDEILTIKNVGELIQIIIHKQV